MRYLNLETGRDRWRCHNLGGDLARQRERQCYAERGYGFPHFISFYMRVGK